MKKIITSAVFGLALSCAGQAWADLSIEVFNQLNGSKNATDRHSAEMYVGGVAKGYLHANAALGAAGLAPLFCYSGDIHTSQAVVMTELAIKEHLEKHPGDTKREIGEYLLLMKLKQMYPC